MITRPREPELATRGRPGVIYTHDAALECIRAAAPGARVRLYPFRERDCKTGEDRGIREDTREYCVSLERLGHRPIAERDTYSLPILREGLARRVRSLVEYGIAAARHGKG